MTAILCALFAGYIDLVELHGSNGQRYWINPHEITTIREPSKGDLQYFAHQTHCVVVTVNGKFVAVRESCDEVRKLVDDK